MTEPMVGSEAGAATVAGLLRFRAAERPDQVAFTFLLDGESEGGGLTYGELDRRASAIASELARAVRPGDRALLLYPPGLDFIAAFFGCLYAGVVAVPAYPPRPNDRSQSRLRAIAHDATPRAALTTEALLAGTVEPRGLLAAAPELAGLRWIPTDTLSADGSEPSPSEPDPDAVAFLQYTSGSTASPKGVMVTHANLLHNERMIGGAFGMDEDSVVVGWLPLYHDMGLIGNVLQPLHAGGRCVLMSPVAFLQRPMRWLEAIDRYRGTTSGGPNFAYELCVRKASPEAIAGLDLSCWQVAYNGAEPVRASTLERFAATFAPSGFRSEAFYPCYGLAEATLFVTGGHGSKVEQERVSCGRPGMEQRVLAVDAEAGIARLAEQEGEIWISGPSVARGYWENPEATATDFHAFLATGEGPFLRTGDLGFLSGGELYVTGRVKDLIILRGRNLYPQDVELTAEGAHPDLLPGGGAAFSVEIGGEERLVIVHEVSRHPREGIEAIAEAVRRAVAAEHEAQAQEVVLIRQAGLPKTSSGKVQRRRCRELYLASELPVVGRSALAGADPAPEIAASLTPESLALLEPAERKAMLAAYLRERAAAILGVPAAAVGLDQPLAGLGLDSLSAIELKGAVESALGLSLPLADLLQGASVGDLAALGVAGVVDAEAVPPLRALAVEGDAPLSPGQRGIWFLHRLAPEGGAYNIAVAARTRGLDVPALTRALAALALRHEALRTIFPVVDDEPVQRVLPELAPDFQIEAAGDDLESRLTAEAWRPFALEWGPLLRARIFQGPNGETLLLVVHHIVADFASLAVLARELAALYRGEALEPPAVRYSDYVRWQAETLAGPRGERLWSYWREQLAGVRDLDLPADHPRPPVQTWRGDARAAAIPPGLAAAVGALASRRGATPFMALLAAFQAQLARYTGQEDFAVGSALAGRPLAELAGVAGYFVNLLPLRADLAGEPGFGELLDRSRRTALAGIEHGDFPFPLLAERLRPVRDPARSPIFQAMLVFQRARPGDPAGLAAFSLGEEGARLDLGGLALESVRLAERRAQLDLALFVAEDGEGGLKAVLELNADLFDGGTAERMLGHLLTLLAGAVAAPETPFWNLPLLAPAERRQVIEEWNATTRDEPADAHGLLLHELFEAQASRTPEAEALVAGEARLTYGEMNVLANRLAHRLRRLGVGPEDRVGVCLRRSERMMVSLFAVLKAGGAYVPMDPAYPRERLALILADSGAGVILGEEATGGTADLAASNGSRWLSLDAEAEEIAGESPENPRAVAGSANLAYLIYTSGSTGRPKAVAVEHRSPTALMHWAREAFSADELSGVLAATSIGFDVSVFEIFAPLSWGGRILIAENLLAFPGLTVAGEVRLICGVPSVVSELVHSGRIPAGVRTVNLAGEAVPPALVTDLAAALPAARILDIYGPSEDTVYSTMARLEPGREVTIGLPLTGGRAHLLDRRGEPVPVGVPGELCLAGAGLARGYLGRPDLTAERFVPDPFAIEPGSRLYRTGDLARRRADGLIDYLGRTDQQVKVRGFRVELGEIEAALARHPRLREAVVVAREEGDRGKRLVAYVAPAGVPPAELRGFLRDILPDYMVPAAFVGLDALPLSATGKVDRRALPAPGELLGTAGFVGFRTPLEEMLAGLVAEVLGVDRVGPRDDFFALGGHSLLATRLLARVSRLFGVDLPVSSVFLHPTVAALAERIAEASGAAASPPVRPVVRPPGGALPLSFGQLRLWLLEQMAPGSPVYHVPGALHLTGPLDLASLKSALAAVVARHEALRTVFHSEEGEPVQLLAHPPVELPLIDLAALPAELSAVAADRLASGAAVAPFDLARGPLWRALAIRLAPDEHLLAITLHHIVADGWSLDLLVSELGKLYSAFSSGAPSPLAPLPVQYADWAVWQRGRLEEGGLSAEVAWWRERLAGCPVLELPTDRARPVVRTSRGGTRVGALPSALSTELERLARREGATPFMTLLALFQAQLARYTGVPSVPVGSPVANRGQTEVEGLIGFFVNMLVLRTPVEGDPSFRELLRRTREVCLGGYAHQDVPFERLVEELRPERQRGRNPLFQVLFQLEQPLAVERLGEAEATVRRVGTGTAKFDLTLSVVREHDGFAATLEYDADLFDPATADRLVDHWRTLAVGIVADPERPLSGLPLFGPTEAEQVRAWSGAMEVPLSSSAPLPFPSAELPRTPLEEELAAIWSEVLGVEGIGVHDDFFDLGGHSLLAHRAAMRIVRRMEVTLDLQAFFEAPTVAAMARRIAESREAASPARELAGGPGEALLSPPALRSKRAVPASELPRTPLEERVAAIWSEVLGVERIGVHDDFFDLGGQSLLTHRVAMRIATRIGVELDPQALFQAPTVAGLAQRIAGLRATGAPVRNLAEAAGEGSPLSFAQQRLWLLDRLEPGGAGYNVPVAVRLEGELEDEALTRALATIVGRHEPLRTVYALVEEEPVQVVLADPGPAGLPLARLDLCALPAPVRERALRDALRAEGTRPFDLARGPVARFLLAGLGPRERVLLATIHHIATDGWSMSVFFRELAALYGDFAAGRPASLPVLPERYADWALWQRGSLASGALDPQLAYWRRQLADAAVLELPADRPRGPEVGDRGALRPVEIPIGLIEPFRGQRDGVTPFTVLLAGYLVLLGRLSGQDDLAVGIPAAGRRGLQTEGMIGFFVNTLVVRPALGDDPGFAALLGRVRDTVLAAQASQDVPFERLVEDLQPERATGVSPLFQAMFAYLANPLAPVAMPGVALTLLDAETATTKYDLTLSVYDEGESLRAWMEYRTALFDPATVERWMGHLRTLLAGAAADPSRPLSALPLLSPAERWQLVGEHNDTALPLPLDLCLHELFERQAALDAGAPAVSHKGESLSYGELNRRANRLAHHLRRLGVGPESRVGLCLDRSPEMIEGMLGILKAGAAYVPLDPRYPAPRLSFIAGDAGLAALVTTGPLRGLLPEMAGKPAVCLDADRPRLAAEPADNPRGGASPAALAYVIYTSGSTGRPKGVGVTHDNIVPSTLARAACYERPVKRFLLLSSFAFDSSVAGIFWSLSQGGTLVLPGGGPQLDPERLSALIAETGISHMLSLPSLHGLMLAQASPGQLASLETVIVAGEACPAELVARHYERCPGALLYNEYGPTEGAVWSSVALLPRELPGGRVTIGRPIANTRIYLLDREMEPVPAGLAGELYIGGPGLARAYLGRPGLTAERFLPDPFGGGTGRRLYRTGDLARFLPGGEIELLGRIDHQVKIRGFRIELGEIEAAVLRFPGIQEAVVVAREDEPGDKRLAAYVVAAGGAAPDLQALRELLRQALPDYMVPSYFTSVATLPLTPNGKVDRRALPAPLSAAGKAGEGRALSPLEELLAGLWRQLLGVERVGAGDRFFDLGGHSLIATRLVSRVRSAFGVELPLVAVFEAPTLEGLARRLAAALGEPPAPAAPPIVAAPRDPAGEPLSFAQKRLWFLHEVDPESSAYNVPGALLLRGPLRPDVLAAALSEIARRHEALRTVFRDAPGEPVQVVLPPAEPSLPVVDLAGLPADIRGIEARRILDAEGRRPFDLAAGPLARAELIRLDGEEHLLAVMMHHIVSDAWSLGITFRELSALYRAFAAGAPSPLPELEIQYADFARWQRSWLSGEVLAAELDHWRRTLDGAPEALELPSDRPRPAPAPLAGQLPFALPAELASSLVALAQAQGWSLFMALLGAFGALLARWSGQRDLVVGAPIANRNRQEVEGLIGFFTNTLALRLDLAGDPSFVEIIRRARAVTLEGYAHQELPFERLVEELAPERDPARTPLFQVMLVVQHDPAAGLSLPGLAAELVEIELDEAKFELTLFLIETGGSVAGHLEFNRGLFDPATAARLLGGLTTLLAGAVAAPEARLSELPLLTAAERRELVAWTTPLAAHPPARCLHDWVAARAALHPEADAVVFGGERLTYGGLVGRARALAARLRAAGVGPDVPVGLYLGRSLDMMVAVLGVLMAGGAYVPLDPTYPRERLRLMLEDAGAPVVLTHGPLAAAVPEGLAAVLRVDEIPAAEDGAEIVVRVDPANLVYVTYTSGSTGRPKGVAMTHAAVSAMLAWQLRTSVAGGGRTLQYTSLSFDVSCQEIFATWCAGGTLVLVSEEVRRDPAALVRLLAEERIERLFQPFVALQQLAMAASDGPLPASLREVMSAGEQLHVTPQMAALFASLPGASLYNHYGPSETHAVTWLALHGDPGGWPESPTIGGPLDHARVFLLDAGLRPVPDGVLGEVWVGGVGLARGYMRADLTAERFLPDPLDWSQGWEPGSRLYRTGDLARRLANGELEFLGRRDHQVKVRGHRVETAEVELALARHPAILQAAVVVRGDSAGTRRLVAYVVFREDAEVPSSGELRGFLAESLPDPMVPTAWSRLAALPMTPSGKLDRRSLARLHPEESWSGDEGFVAPRNPVEELLAGIWKEVLGADRVGVHDDFFQLGGHSLLATQVASRIREMFGIALPLRRIFEAPTLGALAAAIAAAREEAPGASAIPPIRREPREGGTPLSFAQERLWFLHRLQPESPAYNIPLALSATGALDPARLSAALSEVVRRHEVLRTIFVERDGEPVQVVLPVAPEGSVPLPTVDLRELPAPCRDAEARRLAVEEAGRPFDLASGPLLRALLVELAPGHWVVVLNLHHIVTDGWSMGVLVREIKALYGGAALPEPTVQYGDFALWQRRWLSGETLASQLAWWREQLRGAPAALDLMTDRPRPPVMTQRGADHPFAFSDELSSGLVALARREGVTPFMALAAGLFALLSRLTGQRDLTIGSPIANRHHYETEGLIGFFVNTLVLRAELSRAESFRSLLRQVRETSLGAFAHQDLPFEKLVDDLQLDRDLSRPPLFQVALAVQNAPLPKVDLGGVRLTGQEIGDGVAKFDLSFAFTESGDRLAGTLQYATDLFEPPTAVRLAGQLGRVLAAGIARPEAAWSAADLLATGERHQILREWNDAEREWPGDPMLHQLFEARADRDPEAVAVICGGATVTYGELERRANRVAHRLRRLGVGRAEPVGLWMRRSLDLPAALLGILKAGAVYMPFDAAWPEERVAAILAGTGARVLIAGPPLVPAARELAARLPALRHIAAPGDLADPGLPESRLAAAGDAGDPAYLIHTSGSTGEPKGIVVRHRSAANTLRWNNETLEIGPGDRHLAVNSIGFDLSIYDLLGMLGAGAAVRVATEDEIQDPVVLAAILRDGGITTWNSAPSALQRLVPFFPEAGEGSALRRVLLAGDWIPLALPGEVRQAFPNVLIGNFGGATETSVWSNWHRVDRVDPAWAGIPYGRPIANTRYYVLDADLSPCPPGAPGGNFIGGPCVAVGYAGQPALTAESFLPDPYSDVPGARMYATGDRARFWPDGTLEFLGRVDSQVKVRGYRIELGEIEAALLRHAGIGAAVVLAREDVPGERSLVGYVVPAAAPAPTVAELRTFLRETLPEYMVPWTFIELPGLPVTANGKLDREALPAPREVRALETAYVAPRNDLERAIGAVWCEVLQLERIGVQESFFEVGGNSLLVARLQSRLREATGRDVPVVELFRHPTIESLARSLETAAPPTAEKAEAARARTDTRREAMRQLQQARGQRHDRKK